MDTLALTHEAQYPLCHYIKGQIRFYQKNQHFLENIPPENKFNHMQITPSFFFNVYINQVSVQVSTRLV